MTTSFIRLVAARPYSAADVEASAPDIIMRRLATSERTMTPAKASASPRDLIPGWQSIYQPRPRRLRNPTSSDGASATIEPLESSKM